MKNLVRYAILLFILASVSTTLITIANYNATPVLEKREQESTDNALNSLYDNVDSYEDVTSNYSLSGYTTIQNIYLVTLADGSTRTVYKNSVTGKNNNIIFLIGYDETGTIDSLTYVQNQETKGLGSKIAEPEFESQIIGDSADDFTVDTISGATISSSAMKTAIDESNQHYLSEVK